MRKLEVSLHQALRLPTRLIESCGRSAHYQNSTDQTPKNPRDFIVKLAASTSLLLDLSLMRLLVLFEISGTDSTKVARASALSRISNGKAALDAIS